MARPSDYTEEMGDQICAKLAEGKSLASICRDEPFPSTVTVYAWMRKYPEFLNNYVRAREDQADTLADEILAISDDSTNDTIVDPDTGALKANTEWINRSRLRVDARKWIASKLKPKKYGDSMTHKGDPDQPISVSINLG